MMYNNITLSCQSSFAKNSCFVFLAPLRWLVPNKITKSVAFYSSVLIDCRLDDPNVLVSLWLQPNVSTGALIHRIPDGRKLFRSGQVFMLSLIDVEDEGEFVCIAQDKTARKAAFKISLLNSKY